MPMINCNQTHRHTDQITQRQTDGHIKQKIKEETTLLLLIVPQIQSICIIHYIITVLITLKGLLLSACTR